VDESPQFNREISWLAFNGRVLQEAEDPTVPLLERLRFLAIFSSNLDEFFRVRVASLRSLLRLKKKELRQLGPSPKRLLGEIHRVVAAQQEHFGEIYRSQLLPALAERGVRILKPADLSDGQREFVRDHFRREVAGHAASVLLGTPGDRAFLQNRSLYLAADCWTADDQDSGPSGDRRFGLVRVPSPPLSRFVELPRFGDQYPLMWLDDVLRVNMDRIFPGYDVGEAYAVKLSRDAELYLEDEFSGDLIKMIRDSLSKRDTGLPTRFLYDLRTPYPLIAFLKNRFDLDENDLVQGGRYHNFNDLFGFPTRALTGDQFEPFPPLARPDLDGADSLFDVVRSRDVLLHFPYERYDYVTRFLEEAADDPGVSRISITLYRVASDSAVLKALIRAARLGKDVMAFVEVKARFDEASNLEWADQMEAAGVHVRFSMPGLKVHCKVALVERLEAGALKAYAYLGTGNFNEKTARTYADEGLLTSDPRLTEEVRTLFGFLDGRVEEPLFEHLLVAPFHLRKRLSALIDRESRHVSEGREGGMILKVNSLEDPRIIRRLYRASQAGVQIDCIVRGVCGLVPGAEGTSEGIRVRSIVDRFLEHARVYWFRNGGDDAVYLASADWMTRNLSHRVEVAFPIYDPALRAEIMHWVGLQLADNRKARTVDARQCNRYVRSGDVPVRSQYAMYRWLEQERSAR
jgi:polyphosphate kinase